MHRIHDAALLLDCFCLLHGLEKLENELLGTEMVDEITLSGLQFWLDSIASDAPRAKS